MSSMFTSLLPFLKALQRQDITSPQDEDGSNPPADQLDSSFTPARSGDPTVGLALALSQSNPASTAQQVQPQANQLSDTKGQQLMQLLQLGLQGNNQNQAPTTLDPPMRPENPPPPDGSQVQDMSYLQHVPSRIPQAGPDVKPPNLLFNDKKQMRATLSALMQNTGAQTLPALDPDGLLSGDSYSHVNSGWVALNEGGSLLKGYAPKPAPGGTDHSGVTLAAGYDLGQHTVADLRRLNLPEDLITRLSPYVGLKGQAARDALAKQPLSVSRAEADQIDHGAFNSYFNAAGNAFDDEAGEGAFAKLPWQAQTVIGDLWYNQGDLRVKAPQFWKQVTTGDWQGAYQNMQDYTHKDSRLADRARTNSLLVKDAMDRGTLPGR